MSSESLVKLRPRNRSLFVSRARSVMVTNHEGFIEPHSEEGFFVRETRLLSRYRYLMNREPFQPSALSNIDQDSWLGYYIQLPPILEGVKGASNEAQHSLELLVHRKVGDGLHEDLQLTNYNQVTTSFCFSLELEADFADQDELPDKRKQHGELRQTWQKNDADWELRFDYRAHYHYDHQGNVGDADFHRGLLVRILRAGSEPYLVGSRLTFDVTLNPHQTWQACLEFLPLFDGEIVNHDSAQCAFEATSGKFDQLREAFLTSSTAVESSSTNQLGGIALGALARAKEDLEALRRYDQDSDQGWTLSAGIPMYLALFGRDPLIAGWQAEMLSTEMLRGALYELAPWQADSRNDWRDALPGKMLHQARSGPSSILNFNPLGRYYGDLTTPSWYSIGLAELWRWNGDLSSVESLVETALRCVRWMEEYSRSPKHGFFQYQTRSQQGVKNQGWKDSHDAIVYEDGSQVSDPIAPCEVQGYYYASKEQLSQLLWVLGRHDEAKQFRDSANEFKKRFNDAFWMEADGLYALGLDGEGRQIKSVASNTAHCLSAGIADETLAPEIADRLLREDMFSGWGMRTLSSRHPAYNPYSYHRGTVWPMEQGVLAIAFRRYNRLSHLLRSSKALVELAGLFDFCRLPEVLSGHQRDDLHPFPALYPRANSPQAWSSAAVFAMLSSLLGLLPWASHQVLIVDPHLPTWLPEIIVRNLTIGQAVVTIRFFRDSGGASTYEVLDIRGALRVLRRSNAWSLLGLSGDALQEQLAS